MVTNLNELIAYTHRLGDALPSLRESIVIDTPGSTPEKVSALANELPGIPDSYLTVIQAVSLDGVSIGYFQLFPSPFRGDDLTAKIISCNDPKQNPMVNRHKQYGVYQVASWEADPIGVVHAGGMFKVGQVVKYNIGNPTESPVVLADGFQQFLLLAGSLDEIRDKHSDSDDPSQALTEFRLCARTLIPSDTCNILSTWESIAKAVLS